MLARSRVTGALDTSRVREAVAGPGIDTRVWASLAVVTAVRLDDQLGAVCDILLMPDEQPETARVGYTYAGSKWGESFPLYVDDEVLVVAPSGDPNQVLVVVCRLHSPSDPPSDDAVNNPDDAVLVAEPGKSIRRRTTSSGEFLVNANGKASVQSDDHVTLDASDVRLGGESAGESLVKGNTWSTQEGAFDTAVLGAYSIAQTALGSALTVAQVVALLEALLTSLTTAQQARNTGRSSTLSSTSKTS